MTTILQLYREFLYRMCVIHQLSEDMRHSLLKHVAAASLVNARRHSRGNMLGAAGGGRTEKRSTTTTVSGGGTTDTASTAIVAATVGTTSPKASISGTSRPVRALPPPPQEKQPQNAGDNTTTTNKDSTTTATTTSVVEESSGNVPTEELLDLYFQETTTATLPLPLVSTSHQQYENIPVAQVPVSYTHLTLPTNREV